MRITWNSSDSDPRPFTLPPIGNGELSLQIDPEGTMRRDYALFSRPQISGYRGMEPGIRRAGWRWEGEKGERGTLFPFGCFLQEFPGRERPSKLSMTLDTRDAVVETVAAWEDGMRLETLVFCHAEKNLVVIRKRSSRPLEYRFLHRLLHRRLKLERVAPGIWNGVYDLGMIRTERLAVFASRPEFTPVLTQDGIESTGTLTECVWILAWGDDAIEAAGKESFDELLRSHTRSWRDFHARCRSIPLPKQLVRVYETALYHLKISSTRWGIPTGLFDSHWYGKYFGFDELFIMRGVLAAGMLEEARKVAAYRIACLPRARFRACKDGSGDGSCWFPTVTTEDGSDCSVSGFWQDHIFQNANIALGILEYAKASGDDMLLREGGREVIRACALLYEKHMLYECGGKTIIGSCTDLERLGEHRRNAFMTTCSGIALFRAAAEAAEIVGDTSGEAAHFRELARRLAEGLPEKDGRFLAYEGGPAESIGLLGGFYPYGVLPGDDPRGLAALDSFIAAEQRIGNMYDTGKSVCAWYRLWKSLALLYANRREEAGEELNRLAGETGVWGELFEIYEVGMRPFFTTAEGAFISAVVQLYGTHFNAGGKCHERYL